MNSLEKISKSTELLHQALIRKGEIKQLTFIAEMHQNLGVSPNIYPNDILLKMFIDRGFMTSLHDQWKMITTPYNDVEVIIKQIEANIVCYLTIK